MATVVSLLGGLGASGWTVDLKTGSISTVPTTTATTAPAPAPAPQPITLAVPLEPTITTTSYPMKVQQLDPAPSLIETLAPPPPPIQTAPPPPEPTIQIDQSKYSPTTDAPVATVPTVQYTEPAPVPPQSATSSTPTVDMPMTTQAPMPPLVIVDPVTQPPIVQPPAPSPVPPVPPSPVVPEQPTAGPRAEVPMTTTQATTTVVMPGSSPIARLIAASTTTRGKVIAFGGLFALLAGMATYRIVRGRHKR